MNKDAAPLLFFLQHVVGDLCSISYGKFCGACIARVGVLQSVGKIEGARVTHDHIAGSLHFTGVLVHIFQGLPGGKPVVRFFYIERISGEVVCRETDGGNGPVQGQSRLTREDIVAVGPQSGLHIREGEGAFAVGGDGIIFRRTIRALDGHDAVVNKIMRPIAFNDVVAQGHGILVEGLGLARRGQGAGKIGDIQTGTGKILFFARGQPDHAALVHFGVQDGTPCQGFGGTVRRGGQGSVNGHCQPVIDPGGGIRDHATVPIGLGRIASGRFEGKHVYCVG